MYPRMRPPGPAPSAGILDPARARAVRAWCLYDWANSAFATTVIAAILPPFFAEVASHSMPQNLATAAWGYASAGAMLLSAATGLILGATSDRLGRRKPLLFGLVLVGSLATVLMALVPSGQWRGLLVLFVLAFLPFASANVLYDSLLPSVAAPHELHRVSARGFAYGYVGGGLLLAINLAWILAPHRFGIAGLDTATRLSFASVGLWWFGFSIPLFRDVPEPSSPRPRAPLPELVRSAVRELRGIVARRREHPELLRFLLAYWLYSDGIGTVIRMATIYGSEVGIERKDLIGALLLVQIVAAPASLAFGRLGQRIGPRLAVAIGLAGYVLITVVGYLISRPWHFWLLAGLVALVQGGTQSLSRSMFASMVPPSRLGGMFGFYSVSEKLAGVAGPLLFGLAAQLFGSGRFAVFTLLPFFLGGAALLLTVDLERGVRQAAEVSAS